MTISADYCKGFSDGLGAVASALKAIPVPQPAPVPDPPPTPPAPPAMKFGTNLEANTPWQNSAPWADFTRQMTGFYPASTGIPAATSWDANGYPNGGAMSHGWAYNCPAGNWTLKYKGPQNALLVSGKTISGLTQTADGFWTGTIPVAEGDFIRFEIHAAGVTEAHLYTPDAVAGQSFRPAFIAALKASGYQMLRLMTWANVNYADGMPMPATTWANRVTPASYDQTTRGVAYDLMAELSRLTGLPVWVCLPYGADDTFIANAAALFKGLPAPRFELANEPWNTGYGFLGNKINADAMAQSVYAAAAQGNPAVAGAMMWADLTSHMGDLVRGVLGAGNCRIVLSGQAGWDQFAKAALARAKPGAIDVLAVAPYFNPEPWPAVVSPDSILDACITYIKGPLTAGMKANAAAAAAYGAEFETYEAGQSIGTTISNPPAVPRQASAADLARLMADPAVLAQDRPKMVECYTRIIQLCRSLGVAWFMHFLWLGYIGKAGMWPVYQSLNDPPNAKAVALNLGMAGVI